MARFFFLIEAILLCIKRWEKRTFKNLSRIKRTYTTTLKDICIISAFTFPFFFTLLLLILFYDRDVRKERHFCYVFRLTCKIMVVPNVPALAHCFC